MRNMAILNKNGFSLLEVSIAMFLLLFFVGVISAVQGRIVAARGAKTVTEMQSILEAAREYYITQNPPAWPTTLIQIQTVFTNVPTNNVFGNAYTIGTTGNSFFVSTVVPANSVNAIKDGRFAVVLNVGANETINLSTTIPMDTKIGRLQYEQTWVH